MVVEVTKNVRVAWGASGIFTRAIECCKGNVLLAGRAAERCRSGTEKGKTPQGCKQAAEKGRIGSEGAAPSAAKAGFTAKHLWTA